MTASPQVPAGVQERLTRALSTPDPDSLLTQQGVADMMQTTPRHVRRLTAERRLGFVKVGRYVWYRRADVLAYVEAHQVESFR